MKAQEGPGTTQAASRPARLSPEVRLCAPWEGPGPRLVLPGQPLRFLQTRGYSAPPGQSVALGS